MGKQKLSTLVSRGDWGQVRAYIRENGDCPSIEFINKELNRMKCGNSRPQLTATDKCLDVFQLMAEDGEVPHHHHGPESNGYAFKFEINNRQIRFPCFRDGDEWIIMFGFFKKGAQRGRGKWRKEDDQKALEYMRDYLERKQGRGNTEE